MNKTKISKLIIFIIMFILVISISTKVFATELDLGSELNSSEDTESFDGDFSNPSGDLEPKDEDEDPEQLTPPAGETPNPGSGNVSIYEESEMPYTGPVEDTLMVIAFVTFGVIGIYTFKKLSDYSNI